MNGFLRTAPTRRLLSVIVGVVAVIAAGTAIAIAAQGRGPVPKAKPLASAIRQALAAKPVTAVFARISFTNNLISTGQIQGTDPLFSGGSGRLWYSAGRGLRLELQGDNGDASLVVRNGSFWAYDPATSTVYRGTLPGGQESTKGAAREKAAQQPQIPTVAQIQRELTRAMAHLAISRAIPGDTAHQPTYTVQISPRQSSGLLGRAQLAWDALRGVPLRVAVYARGNSTPVLALQATNISYGRVPASVFAISAPRGAKVVNVSLPSPTAQRQSGKPKLGRLPFTAVAPTSLAGLSRTSMSRMGKDGVAILYGHYLGGVVVIERLAPSGASALSAPSSGDQPGLNLPTLSINGVKAQELDTALGTVVRFNRAGIDYTVIGSVTPSVADAAARAL